MRAARSQFYVTGGTLPRDAPCYVTRQADRDLLDGLRTGAFCYVLTTRQMGKSSLMVRAATRLRTEGVTCVVLDMTALGQSLTQDQWYDGLLSLVGRQLDLEDQLERFWHERQRLGPLQRWTTALREVVVAKVNGPVVIFVDEIDAVRSLPFSTDEFFAAIRELFNRRAEDPALGWLTFCLIGVATPGDLIKDPRTTPFNIGRRIELHDFTEAECAPLLEGLRPPGNGASDGPARLLRRILHWTGGHPYLTQRLCHAVAQAQAEPGERDLDIGVVDDLCDALFLSSGARVRDDNLIFARDRILAGTPDVATLLDVYGRVRAGRRVVDDETNPHVSRLKLAGTVSVVDGGLRVRNRIYASVFTADWVRSSMPDAEVRRQRDAYRRGALQAGAAATLVVGVAVVLAWMAWRQAHAARLARDSGDRVARELSVALAQARRDLVQADSRAAAASRPGGGAGTRVAEARPPAADRRVPGQSARPMRPAPALLAGQKRAGGPVGARGGGDTAGGLASPGCPKARADEANTGYYPYRYRGVASDANVVSIPELTRELYAAPVVVGDVAYVATDSGFLYAVGLGAAPSVRWRCRVSASTLRSVPAVARDGTIYLGCDDGSVYRVDPRARGVIGRYRTDKEIEAPVAIGRDGTVYVGNWHGKLFALRRDLSAAKWVAQLGGAIGACPALAPDGTVLVGTVDSPKGGLYALEPDTGAVIWYKDIGGVHAAPAVVNGSGTWSVIAATLRGRVHRLDKSGTVLCVFPPMEDAPKREFRCSPAIRSAPGISAIFIGNDDGFVYKLDAVTLALQAKAEIGARVATEHSSPTLSAGAATPDDDGARLFVGAEHGPLHALRQADLRECAGWPSPPLGRLLWCSPVITPGNQLLAIWRDGPIVVFR